MSAMTWAVSTHPLPPFAALPQASREARGAHQQGGADLEQVAHHEQVGELGDGRVRVAVDGDDRLGGLHARPGAGWRPDRRAPRYSSGLTILPVWPICWAYGIQPGVHGGARRPDGPAEHVGELPDDGEPVRPADAAAAGDDDPGLLDRRRGAGLGHAVQDRDERAARARRRRRALSTLPAPAAGSARHRVRAEGDDPAARR